MDWKSTAGASEWIFLSQSEHIHQHLVYILGNPQVVIEDIEGARRHLTETDPDDEDIQGQDHDRIHHVSMTVLVTGKISEIGQKMFSVAKGKMGIKWNLSHFFHISSNCG
jgi:hypothetical protein